MFTLFSRDVHSKQAYMCTKYRGQAYVIGFKNNFLVDHVYRRMHPFPQPRISKTSQTGGYLFIKKHPVILDSSSPHEYYDKVLLENTNFMMMPFESSSGIVIPRHVEDETKNEITMYSDIIDPYLYPEYIFK